MPPQTLLLYTVWQLNLSTCCPKRIFAYIQSNDLVHLLGAWVWVTSCCMQRHQDGCSAAERLGAGPAAPPVVEVPKRARTESAAAGRADAARHLLDTDMVAPPAEQRQQPAADATSPYASLEGVRREVLRMPQSGSAQCQAGGAPAHDASTAAGVTTHLAQAAAQDCALTYGGAPNEASLDPAACSQKLPEDLQLDTPVKLPDTPSAASRELSGSAKLA